MINKSDDSVDNNSLFRCCFVGNVWRLSRNEAVSGVGIKSSELSRYAVVVWIL